MANSYFTWCYLEPELRLGGILNHLALERWRERRFLLEDIFVFESSEFLWSELLQTSERCQHFLDDFLAGIVDSELIESGLHLHNCAFSKNLTLV
jgi:hypothetical protein